MGLRLTEKRMELFGRRRPLQSISKFTKHWSIKPLLRRYLKNMFYQLTLMLQTVSRISNKTSWIGNIFLITGHLWGESSGHRWILLSKALYCIALVISVVSVCWTNSRYAMIWESMTSGHGGWPLISHFMDLSKALLLVVTHTEKNNIMDGVQYRTGLV